MADHSACQTCRKPSINPLSTCPCAPRNREELSRRTAGAFSPFPPHLRGSGRPSPSGGSTGLARGVRWIFRPSPHPRSLAGKVKVWQLELDEFEEEVKDVVIQAGEEVSSDLSSKSIPTGQVEAAKSLEAKVRTAGIPVSRALDTVRREIYELAREYEITRASGPSNASRTRKMNEIAAGMRTLAIAGKALRTELTRSDSVGRRLAAVCMLQVEPRPRYFKWLIERVKTETQPFVFYQAAVAILEMVAKKLYINPDDARSEIKSALNVISGFKGGQPDQNTIDALNEALMLLT